MGDALRPAPVQLGADEGDEPEGDEGAPDWARFNRQVGGVAERTKPSVVYLTVVAPNAPYGDQYPTETGSGVILAGFSTVCAMALIWWIWWLAALAFIGVIATAIWHTFNYDRDFDVPAADVAATEDARTRLIAGRA